jgi:glycosyltransferase involved in cell wall biosynthesis
LSKIYQYIKFAFWFVFKSPQRKFGYLSVWQDIVGIFAYLCLKDFSLFKLKPISICVGIHNRSDLFLNHFLPSLLSTQHLDSIELSVFDCQSDDIIDLEIEVRKIWKGKLVFKSENIPFSRSAAFNKAVKQSQNKILFICDADFSLPSDLVIKCNKFTLGKLVWFPIVFYLYKNKPNVFDEKHGEWMQWGGKGILACKRKYFDNIGGLDESFKTWGKEDDDLWMKFYKARNYVIRSREKGLLHHWHPSLNPKYQVLADKADKGLL